jgi:CheY-like chemotaxis protein
MNPRALVIDDNPVIRRVLRLHLEGRGWAVVEAVDAFDGRTAFFRERPTLVILDLLMPINAGVDAMQLAALIDEEDSGAVLLVLSSFASREDVRRFFAARRIRIFDKPSAGNPSFDELLSCVDGIFRALSITFH